jgi:hypothetical protein
MGEDDFAPGNRDEFTGTDLQSCNGETVIWYPGSVSKVRVLHVGDDSWGVKSIAVTFDDSSYISCGSGETVYVTGGEFVDMVCN